MCRAPRTRLLLGLTCRLSGAPQEPELLGRDQLPIPGLAMGGAENHPVTNACRFPGRSLLTLGSDTEANREYTPTIAQLFY